MGNADQDVIDLARDEDFDMWVSAGFVINCSQKSFIQIRAMIENHLEHKRGEEIVYQTASSAKLFIVKENEYEKLKDLKY